MVQVTPYDQPRNLLAGSVYTNEENSVAALAIGDAAYGVVNGVRLWVRWATAYTIGKKTLCADVFSRPDVYMIVETLFKDSIGLNYRLMFETKQIILPETDGLIDSGNAKSGYVENGIRTTPGFVDLSKN